MVDRSNKHPIDQGEEAHQRHITEMEADELVRLERIVPIYPKMAKAINLKHMQGLTSLPGNKFYEHKDKTEPDDIVA